MAADHGDLGCWADISASFGWIANGVTDNRVVETVAIGPQGQIVAAHFTPTDADGFAGSVSQHDGHANLYLVLNGPPARSGAMPGTFTVKVPQSFPVVNSARVRDWLSRYFTHGNANAIAPDPGAGARVLRLSLPERVVEKLAVSLSNPPAVALRRLIVSNIKSLPPPDQKYVGTGSAPLPRPALPSGLPRVRESVPHKSATPSSLIELWARSNSAMSFTEWAQSRGFATGVAKESPTPRRNPPVGSRWRRLLGFGAMVGLLLLLFLAIVQRSDQTFENGYGG